MPYDNNDGPVYSMLNGKNPCIGQACGTNESGPYGYSGCFGQQTGNTQYRVNGGDCEAFDYTMLCYSNGNVLPPGSPGAGTIQTGPVYVYGSVNPCEHPECSSLC